MTKEEIKALVKAKIAGQGTMVDVGGALPKVLDGIVDIIPEASAGLGLSGVYTEGGNIEVPEGTFAILAAADESYLINEVEEEVPSGNIGIYLNDGDPVLSLIPVGGSGPRVWETDQTIDFTQDSTPTLDIDPAGQSVNMGDVVTFNGAFEEEGDSLPCQCVLVSRIGGNFYAQCAFDQIIVPITVMVASE